MRYRCLIIDHDDTAVDSTRRVHYQAHLRAMEALRPGHVPIDVEAWFAKNHHPGIMAFLVDELGFTEAEMQVEERIWREFTRDIDPPFFPGFLEALAEYRTHGGAIVVASHSDEAVVRRHYLAAANGTCLVPDLIFGWDLGPELRKPNPFAVEETLRRLALDRSEVLVVDDLKPGIDMAVAAGVDAAAACWSHDIGGIRDFMRRTCVATFATVDEFAEFVLR